MLPFHSPEIILYCFDLDGTLVNTEQEMNLHWHQAIQKSGMDPEIYPYNQIVGLSFDQWERKLKNIYGETFPIQTFFDYFKDETIFYTSDTLKAMPGARELLSLLKSKGKKCVIVTANQLHIAKKLLEKTDLLHFFSFIFSRDDVVHSKPDPSLYQLALAHNQCEPHQAYAIEDSLAGSLAAQRADIPFIFVPSYPLLPEELNQLSFQKKCTSLMELLD